MIQFYRAITPEQKEAINLFLLRHNERGGGSNKGYVASFAAESGGKMVAAAKFCPLHTPQAAKFFSKDWTHVYCLQRLAADHAPENLLSEFLGWCLREMGKDSKVWYVATYADTRTYDSRNGQPHNGGIYRATNAVYCGLTNGNRVEGFVLDGQRHSMRQGPRTTRLDQIPAGAKILRNRPQHRYCWPVGSPLQRVFRRRDLDQRMAKY